MASEIYSRLGAAIRDRRTALGLSQAQLADRAGLVRTSVTMIERGSQSVLIHQLVEIAKALRVSPLELLSRGLDVMAEEPLVDHAPDIERLLADLHNSVGRITRR